MPDDLTTPQDNAIERAAAALRPLPAVDPEAHARLLVAVQADAARRLRAKARRRLAVRAAIGGAVAAGVVAVLVLVSVEARARRSAAAQTRSASTSAAPRSVMPVSAVVNAGVAPSVMVPLVVSAPRASSVSVVGDFTGWDEHRVRMSRDPASGLWVTSVTVRPGRHVYAFVADDSLWMLDPRAPVASDPDFGHPGSLLLVGRP